MAKKFFTDESLAMLVDEIKSYINEIASKKASIEHTHDTGEITLDVPLTFSTQDILSYVLEDLDYVIADIEYDIKKQSTSSGITYDGNSGNIIGKGDTLANILQDYDQKMTSVESSITNHNIHLSDKKNPHGVTLSQLGVTATSTELNYMDGVTSNVQAQLDSNLASAKSHSNTNLATAKSYSDNNLATAKAYTDSLATTIQIITLGVND